jgi:allantoinase
VNLLHLSSRKALEAALTMAGVFPHIDFKREITVGISCLDVDTRGQLRQGQPAHPPREDVEYLWRAVLDGKVDWIVSDHACCSQEVKGRPRRPGRHLAGQVRLRRHRVSLSGVFSEGASAGWRRTGWPSCSRSIRRGATACWTRATSPSARCRPGAARSRSPLHRRAADRRRPGYTPFEGQELTGQVTATFLRGRLAWENGAVVGPRAAATSRGRPARR